MNGGAEWTSFELGAEAVNQTLRLRMGGGGRGIAAPPAVPLELSLFCPFQPYRPASEFPTEDQMTIFDLEVPDLLGAD